MKKRKAKGEEKVAQQYPLFRLSKRRKVPMVAAIRVILWHWGRILLLKRTEHVRNAGKWELPGGKIEEGEFFHGALEREVTGETGLKISTSSLSFFGWVSSQRPSEHYLELILEYRLSGERPQIKISPEHIEYRWVTVEEALKSRHLVLTPRTRKALRFLV